VIPHKTYSRADVVHCMLWPSLVVVASAVTFLYLEARRSRLTFCGRRPSAALVDGEKSQLKPASSSTQHATKIPKLPEHGDDDADRHQHGLKPAGGAVTSPKVSDGARQRDSGRHFGDAERLNGQVRSSVDVRATGASPTVTGDGPCSRRAHRSHARPTAASMSQSASELAAVGVETGIVGRPGGERRAADVDSTGRRLQRRGVSDDKLVGSLDSTPGRCASESHLHKAV